MKKNLLAVIAMLSAMPFISNAQSNTFPSSGNVGIGTTSPGSLLHLYSASPALRLSPSGYGTTDYATYIGSLSTAVGVLQLGNNGQNDIVAGNTAAGGFLRFIVNNSNTFPTAANGTVAMTINSTGSVGIGTTSPGGTLEVNTPTTYFDTTPTFAAAINSQSSSSNTLVISNGGAVSRAAGINFHSTPTTDGRLFNSGNIRSGWTGSSYSSTYVTIGSAATGTTYNDELTLTGGNVGIGTTSPGALLTISSTGAAGNSTEIRLDNSFNHVNNRNWSLGLNTVAYGDFSINQSNAQDGDPNAAGTERFYIGRTGLVGIGTTSPDQLLTVNGTIHSTEVKVDLSVPGPDYVFDPNYQLPTLTEIKTYVDKNHHLPEIQSADEMAKNGIDLGDMNTKLLKKVEELTLYLIEKDKEISDQRKDIDQLRKDLSTLQSKPIQQ